ncbi:T9SS type A sorting domain-containing protein [Adhaeribacter soli]|uniref:T9SS type A sorting domain-containing protein n=1 Tax=Adhaeribacter soli TaxID=2607655 RepID=A0A5N1IQ31_9BACT|nr:T9SS type A sorting domain-containing protein [Adhaeribacter soli]KAA9331123.1 T9SS type A sorting domain-containing protein [Adhaeribacter soli]
MKKIYLLLGLMLAYTGAKAQYVSPNTGQKLTMNSLLTAGAVTNTGGAYILSADLTISENDTLSITTNETLRLADNIRITIKGAMLVNPPDSVKITADNPANTFHTLRFESSTKVSKLKKTLVEYGSGVRVIDAGLEMDSCVVRFNERVAQSGAINISGTIPVTVANSRIYRNARSGISTPSNGGTVIIRNNWLFENGTEPGLYPQINLGISNNGPLIITGNTIIGINATTNRSGGIGISNLLTNPTVTNCLIEKNTIRYNSYGVGITGGNIHGYIKRNLIENNNVNPTVLTTGSGLNFNTTTTNQLMVAARNIIRNNHWGVTIQAGTKVASGPRPSLGRIGSADTADVGMNRIYNNVNGAGPQIWDLYNNTTDTVYAENNDWGTNNLVDIEDHIYHKTDSSTHGFVDYLPLYQPVTGTVKELAKSGFKVYPNPASGFVIIKANATLLSGKTNVRFFNALGQEVLTLQPQVKGGELRIDTQKLPAGIYTYRIENNEKVTAGKLMINR